MKKKTNFRTAGRVLLFCAAAVMAVCFLLTGEAVGAEAGKKTEAAQGGADTIVRGIFVGPVDLGGMKAEEAQEALDAYEESLQGKKLSITAGKESVETTLDRIGFQMNTGGYVEQAMSFGKTGNLIKRYKEQKDIERENVVYKPEFTVSDDKIIDLLDSEGSVYDREAKNASMTRTNGQFVIKKEKTGRKLSVEDTLDKIKASVLSPDWDGNDLTVGAVTMDVEPEYTSELFARCKDVLGTFSTTFATSSSSRANNLANAARLLNGTVIYPGEVFSAGTAMSPISAANGYSMAGAYQQGKLVDSIGGGVCQVSTTLYNAILKAELEIVERHNHSMIVTYVEPAMDAAIAGEGNGKDLKFRNNTDVPVYMEVYTVGRRITFTLYGEETRDLANRTVKYVSEVLERLMPGPDKVTEDPEKPESYEKVEQGAHVGYKANLWKVVYENGKEVSREKVNYSYYAPEPRYVTKGTKEEKETPTPKPTKSPKPTKKPKPTPDAVDPVETEEPDITPEPLPTPAPTPEPLPTPEPEPEPEVPGEVEGLE